MPKFHFDSYFKDLLQCVQNFDESSANVVVSRLCEVKKCGARVLVFGNGGSASIAAHAVVDFNKAAGVKALCFTDASLLTCYANDFGYENAYANALKQHGEENDLVIAISSSGRSENMVRVAKSAKEVGCGLVTFSGFSENNPLRSLGDENFYCHSLSYNIVENTHQAWLLAIIDAFIAEQSG